MNFYSQVQDNTGKCIADRQSKRRSELLPARSSRWSNQLDKSVTCRHSRRNISCSHLLTLSPLRPSRRVNSASCTGGTKWQPLNCIICYAMWTCHLLSINNWVLCHFKTENQDFWSHFMLSFPAYPLLLLPQLYLNGYFKIKKTTTPNKITG